MICPSQISFLPGPEHGSKQQRQKPAVFYTHMRKIVSISLAIFTNGSNIHFSEPCHRKEVPNERIQQIELLSRAFYELSGLHEDESQSSRTCRIRTHRKIVVIRIYSRMW